MKNKFLLMGVVTALFAVIVLPSAFATETDVNASVGSGALTLTAEGDFAAPLTFTALETPPVTDQTLTITKAAATNYFAFGDSDDTNGGSVQMYLDSNAAGELQCQESVPGSDVDGNFVYTGNSSAQECLSFANLTFYPDNALTAPTVGQTATDNAYYIAASTTNIGTAVTEGSFNADFADGKQAATASAAYQYFSHTSATPIWVQLSLEQLDLLVPAGSNTGSYASTLTLTVL